jgi:hypothetical protein
LIIWKGPPRITCGTVLRVGCCFAVSNEIEKQQLTDAEGDAVRNSDSSVLHKPTEVFDALAERHLTYEILSTAIIAGEIAKDACTTNDPVNAGGFYAWAKTVRSLADQLVGEGWIRANERGLPLIVSPDRTMAIVVGLGDEMTGHSERTPRTKHTKGAATVAVINRNVQMRLQFDGDEPESDLESDDVTIDPNIETYVLLRHRSADVVLAELSVPASSDQYGRINSWSVRIILPVINLNPDPPSADDDSGDSSDQIDVKVSRRAN